MKLWMLIVAAVALFLALVGYACIVVGSDAERQMEKYTREMEKRAKLK